MNYLRLGVVATWMLVISVLVLPVQAATDVEFKTMDGQTVKLSDYRGKWVVVNYWATWCPPCLVEMPELSFFHERIRIKMLSYWV